MLRSCATTLFIAVTAHAAVEQAGPPKPTVSRHYEGTKVIVGDQTYNTWRAYAEAMKRAHPGRKCGIRPDSLLMDGGIAGGIAGGQGDCARNFTNPADEYDPSATPIMEIPVVFHVIRTDDGQLGHIPIAQVTRQMEILNEDFRAIAGTNGGGGLDARIQFKLATSDPNGNITNGIYYYNNSDWFTDGGPGNDATIFAPFIAWDPSQYLNIYSNDAGGGGTLAYSSIPQYENSPPAGSPHDRIVMRWDTVGENAPIGAPYHLGHTFTHEVGHYCGLWHVFSNAAGANQCGGACNATGDTICDTTPQSNSTNGCQGDGLCDFPANSDNYMDYSDDQCQTRFTAIQIRRMRCTLMNWRADVFYYVDEPCNPGCEADLDLDGDVDGGDLGALFAAWGACPAGGCCADFNNDGNVDGTDLGLIFAAWGECFQCPEGWEKDCNGTCFPSVWIDWWKGDGVCDDGSFIPFDSGCNECPPDVPMYLNCDTFNNDDGDCP
jgi:hypothetical protein